MPALDVAQFHAQLVVTTLFEFLDSPLTYLGLVFKEPADCHELVLAVRDDLNYLKRAGMIKYMFWFCDLQMRLRRDYTEESIMSPPKHIPTFFRNVLEIKEIPKLVMKRRFVFFGVREPSDQWKATMALGFGVIDKPRAVEPSLELECKDGVCKRKV